MSPKCSLDGLAGHHVRHNIFSIHYLQCFPYSWSMHEGAVITPSKFKTACKRLRSRTISFKGLLCPVSQMISDAFQKRAGEKWWLLGCCASMQDWIGRSALKGCTSNPQVHVHHWQEYDERLTRMHIRPWWMVCTIPCQFGVSWQKLKESSQRMAIPHSKSWGPSNCWKLILWWACL